MPIQWAALVSFVLVTTFTPGPNNISAMSSGITYGYGKSLKFLSGIVVGFFVVMCICALIATMLFKSLPFVEPYLQVIGSLYIVWLAIHTFMSSLNADAPSAKALGFHDGLLLQVLNIKVIVYGLTLYSTFFASISGKEILIGLSATALAIIGFAAISLWNLAGTSLSRFLQKAVLRRILASALSLLLLYSAAESSGLMRLIESGFHHT
jgi:cysteine/O-acetylserine efflux protein